MAGSGHDHVVIPALLKLGYGAFDPTADDALFYLTDGYLELLGHSKQQAQALVAEYKATQTFTEEFVCHEGPAGMAIYIHYVIALRGSTNTWTQFIDWRADFARTEQYARWRNAVWPDRT